MIVITAESLDQQMISLEQLLDKLKLCTELQSKNDLLRNLKLNKDFLESSPLLREIVENGTIDDAYVINSIIAIGQGSIVFRIPSDLHDAKKKLKQLIKTLCEVEEFYSPIGGIIGYHLAVLQLIQEKDTNINISSRYIHPEGLNIDTRTAEIDSAIRWGIETLEEMAELYPVGGAGDRLSLEDNNTKTPLPAAVLPFLGRSLLEGLIRDLQAREYLHFKLTNKQINTPIALMTSEEKNNHAHMIKICESCDWFGRSKESFFFFRQPLVPVITKEGNWSLYEPLSLCLKPGGHGVIWKLAKDTGAFEWLSKAQRKKLLVRQINNPISGIDNALIAFTGLGVKNNKNFGFISCERRLNAAEGVDIITETITENGYDYCLTNIEYTDFAKRGIHEIPVKPQSPYSTYPSNTNILFADIASINSALETSPFPGKLINMKTFVPYIDSFGNTSFIEGGRLETVMQNIADSFVYHSNSQIHKSDLSEKLDSFLIYNRRNKTISTTKKSYKEGESVSDTPEQAFFDLLENNRELLSDYCHFELPNPQTTKDYLKNGPNVIFVYHPALGPIYDVIQQKIRKGRVANNSEFHLELAEVNIENLELDGSLIVKSDQPLGFLNDKGILSYNHGNSIHLHNVKVKNKGIDTRTPNIYWKNQIERIEALEIVLEEGAEFFAENVFFEGNIQYTVPKNHRLEISKDKQGRLIEKLSKISQPSWWWSYSFDEDNKIILRIER